MTVFEDADRRLLPGFRRTAVNAPEGPVQVAIGGAGPPVLLLHGDPQTHLCWHLVAPRLAERFTVVLTDIRGRGETHKPPAAPGHAAYAKRAMAQEQVDVMAALGYPSFALVGHDRGARVARRLALDHPQAVRRLAVMDIVPALDFYDRADAALAQDYFYFFFLTQPAPYPETLIAGDPAWFMDGILFGLLAEDQPYDPLALAAYRQAATTPAAIAAMCECFRAGLTCDRDHDRADRAAGRSIACPTLVMWGEQGVVARHFDMRAVWRRWCAAPSFLALPCGHFLPEESPDAVATALLDFLQAEA